MHLRIAHLITSKLRISLMTLNVNKAVGFVVLRFILAADKNGTQFLKYFFFVIFKFSMYHTIERHYICIWCETLYTYVEYICLDICCFLNSKEDICQIVN